MGDLILVFCVALLLLLTVAGLAEAVEPDIYLPGPGSGGCGGYDRALPWEDQVDFWAGVGSSDVINAYGLVSEVANDFIIEKEITIRKVYWWGEYWNGFEGTPVCDGFLLRFYMDVDCRPEANPLAEYPLLRNDYRESLAPGHVRDSQFMYECCIDLLLEPGHYWLSVQATDHDFPPQWGRIGSCPPGTQICPSCVRSEYFGQAEWMPLTDIVGAVYDASIALEDECVLSPTKVMSWGAVKGLYW